MEQIAQPVLVGELLQFTECASDNCHRPAEKECEYCFRKFCKRDVSFREQRELHLCAECAA